MASHTQDKEFLGNFLLLAFIFAIFSTFTHVRAEDSSLQLDPEIKNIKLGMEFGEARKLLPPTDRFPEVSKWRNPPFSHYIHIKTFDRYKEGLIKTEELFLESSIENTEAVIEREDVRGRIFSIMRRINFRSPQDTSVIKDTVIKKYGKPAFLQELMGDYYLCWGLCQGAQSMNELYKTPSGRAMKIDIGGWGVTTKANDYSVFHENTLISEKRKQRAADIEKKKSQARKEQTEENIDQLDL